MGPITSTSTERLAVEPDLYRALWKKNTGEITLLLFDARDIIDMAGTPYHVYAMKGTKVTRRGKLTTIARDFPMALVEIPDPDASKPWRLAAVVGRAKKPDLLASIGKALPYGFVFQSPNDAIPYVRMIQWENDDLTADAYCHPYQGKKIPIRWAEPGPTPASLRN